MKNAALILMLLAAAAVGPPDANAQTTPTDDVVVVEMVEKSATEYAFQPARVTVAPGQVVRFVQTGAVPHNVEFKDTPEGARLDAIRMGPFLMGRGESYEVPIDERFADGVYDYVCTPHVMMGMSGEIVVDAAAREK